MCASIIGTWSFSLLAVNEIVACLEHGDNILHAMEMGISGLFCTIQILFNVIYT